MYYNSCSFSYAGMRPIVEEAVLRTNYVLQQDEFFEEISRCGKFEMADIDGGTLARLLVGAGLEMYVDLYYALSPLKSIDGYDDPHHPETVHLNIWTLGRSVSSVCNSLIHGCIHALNAMYPALSFGHGGHHAGNKLETAPYKVGMIAQNLISDGRSPYVPLEHEAYCDAPKGQRDPLNGILLSSHAL